MRACTSVVAWFVAAAVIVGGCSSTVDGTAAPATATGSTPTTSPGDAAPADAGVAGQTAAKSASGASANGVLKVINFTSKIGMLRHEDTAEPALPADVAGLETPVTFIAIVTDTKGLDTIAGGALVDDTGATYAAFGAGANKGTFTAQVGWKDIQIVRSIDFTGTKGTRTFSAKFFDNDGNVATAAVPIDFACRVWSKNFFFGWSSVDGGAAAGSCFDFASDRENCGTAGNRCKAGTRCAAGQCSAPADSSCFGWDGYGYFTCADVCTALGKTCKDGAKFDDAKCSGAGSALRCTDQPGGGTVRCNCD